MLQVADLHATMQLLADCRAAAGGRRPWAAAANARLQTLPAELNALDMASVASSAPPAVAFANSAFGAAGAAAAAEAAAEKPPSPDSSASPTGGGGALAAPSAGSAAGGMLAATRGQVGAASAISPSVVDGPDHERRQPPADLAAAQFRRACRDCVALLKELAAGGQSSSKRD